MVNHFATLLVNTSALEFISAAQNITQSYALADSQGFVITTSSGKILGSSDEYPVEGYFSRNSKFVSRNYVPVALPPELHNFYDIIFPTGSSVYFKEFLLYCYLRLVAASDRADFVKSFDSRISYDLDDITDYHKEFKIQSTVSSSAYYDLLVTGQTNFLNSDISSTLNFIVTQVPGSSAVRIYCPERELYYKAGQRPSKIGTGMEISVVMSTSNNSSLPIPIGDTGLSCTITGPFNDATRGFLVTSAKTWTFSVRLSCKFDFSQLYKDLSSKYLVVDSMLDFHSNIHDTNYRNIWTTHHNDVYKLAGLLLAYVERVNSVWLSKVT